MVLWLLVLTGCTGSAPLPTSIGPAVDGLPLVQAPTPASAGRHRDVAEACGEDLLLAAGLPEHLAFLPPLRHENTFARLPKVVRLAEDTCEGVATLSEEDAHRLDTSWWGPTGQAGVSASQGLITALVPAEGELLLFANTRPEFWRIDRLTGSGWSGPRGSPSHASATR